MAILRDIGKKRRANNGEVIDLQAAKDDSKKQRKEQEGFLGIGAKAAPGTEIELGAYWGKADEMRKNNKGQLHDQSQSPLFTVLPAEIRQTIFALACTSYDDLARPYRQDRKYYRPGHHYFQKYPISVLQTCKRIYSEARLLPISTNTHTFWLFNGPRFTGTPEFPRRAYTWKQFYERLGPEQANGVQSVHVFVQQPHLEAMGSTWNFPTLDILRTRRLRMTLRHSDWWSWESPPASSDRLGICPWRGGRTSAVQMLAEPAEPSLDYMIEGGLEDGRKTWGRQVCEVTGLRVLEMEFETDARKKDQLMDVVERAKHWKFPLQNGPVLEWDGRIDESEWNGLLNLIDDNGVQLRAVTPVMMHNKPVRSYYVVRMVWRPSATVRDSGSYAASAV